MNQNAPDLSKLKIDRDLAPVRGRRRRRWVWLVALMVVAVAGGGWFALQPRVTTVATTPVVTAFPSQQFVVLNATGYVVAQRKAAISSKATGRLEWLGVREGSRVKAGDVIARIDSRDVVAQSESAEANVAAARAALDAGTGRGERRRCAAEAQPGPAVERLRIRRLGRHRQGARRPRDRGASPTRAPTSTPRRRTRATRKVAVDHTLIRAPFDGVVLTKNANVGDLITPFSSPPTPRARSSSMADMSTLEVEADVVRSEHRQGQGRASRRRSSSTRCPTRAFAAASAAWCRPSTARRRR